MITIIDGQFFRSNPTSRPKILRESSEVMESLTKIEERKQEELEQSTATVDRILYLSQPVYIQGKVRGVFLAVHLTAGELDEAHDVFKVVLAVLFVFLILAALAIGASSQSPPKTQ